jgi:putative FmdB family regulatory protein
MPTYDYVCDACDHAFELFQSIVEEPKKKCPECGKRKLRRLFGTGAAIVFKGSGFYQTDYRSDSYKARAKADAGDSSSNGKSDSAGKGDSSAKSDSAAKPAEAKPASTGSTTKRKATE